MSLLYVFTPLLTAALYFTAASSVRLANLNILAIGSLALLPVLLVLQNFGVFAEGLISVTSLGT